MSNHIDDIIKKLSKEKPKKAPLHKYKLKLLLIGFTSKLNTVKLDNDTRIRRGTKRELTDYYKEFKLGGGIKEFAHFLEYTYESRNHAVFASEFDIVEMQINLLFKILFESDVNSPYCQKFGWNEKKGVFLPIALLSHSRIPDYSNTILKYEKSNGYDLRKAWRNLQSTTNSSFRTAFKRCYLANHNYDQENRIIDLLIAYEALFLSETGELSYRLSLRVASFLQSHGYIEKNDVNEMFIFMKKAYGLRSKIVHGEIIKPKDLFINNKQMNLKYCNEVLSLVLRDSLFIYLSKYSDLKSSAFIDEIDKQILKL